MLKILDQKGQSLLELIVALFILVAVLTATVVLIVTSINAGREARNKLIATNLAREGIEIVRNIRDSNWADPGGVAWDDGLYDAADRTAAPIIDNTNVIEVSFAVTDFSDTDWTQLREEGIYYLQGNGSIVGNSVFYRLLYIDSICHDSNDDEIITVGGVCTDAQYNNKVGIRVISEVRWPSANSNKEVIIEDRLYNWQVL